jgi:acyl-CoA synthetase (AMP-forming)/AMP-acid ligase II
MNLNDLEASLGELVARAARDNPQGIAFIDGSSRRTWQQVAARVAEEAAALRNRGLTPGARIAVLAGATEMHVELTLALSWAGLTVVPLNTRLSLVEHTVIVGNADVQAFFHDVVHRERASAVARNLGISKLLSIEELLGGVRTSRGDGIPLHEWNPDDLAAILYTGGTTGTPKGVRVPVHSMIIQGRTVQTCLRYDRESVVLHTQPIFHVAGCGQLYGAVLAAGTLVFRADVGPAATYEEISQHGVNSIGLVPTTLAMLLNFPGRHEANLKHIRSVVYGAAAITETLLVQAMEAMPNAGFCQFYGQTETGPVTALLAEDHVLTGPRGGKLRTAGRPRPHVLLKITDADGNELPTGAPGEILISGIGLCDGYWRDDERTAELFRNGWLRTGDVGIVDEDGYVRIVDRYKDMIVTGGENVFSAEVEHALAAHPEVESCAVFAVPDAFWGEAVHAAVIRKPGSNVTTTELIAFCRSQIAGYKCPKSIDFRSEPFPLSGVGKVLKTVLRQQATKAKNMTEINNKTSKVN